MSMDCQIWFNIHNEAAKYFILKADTPLSSSICFYVYKLVYRVQCTYTVYNLCLEHPLSPKIEK